MMKSVMIIGLILIVLFPLYSSIVYMENGLKYEGYYEAKIGDNIYLLNGKTVYELPITGVDKIMNGMSNKTSEYLNREDFSKIEIGSNEYDVISYGFIESEQNRIRQKLLDMSDREFAIYEMEQRQKQADELSKKINRISNTMWTQFGISLGLGLVAVIIAVS
jgi:hypothetical protein